MWSAIRDQRFLTLGGKDYGLDLANRGEGAFTFGGGVALDYRLFNLVFVGCGRTLRVRGRRRAERAQTFLSIGRRLDGRINLDLVDECIANAVARTHLLRRIDAEEADSDAPTEQVMLDVRRPSKRSVIFERTVIGRLQSLEGK